MKRVFVSLVFLGLAVFSLANNPVTIDATLLWENEPITIATATNQPLQLLSFEGASYEEETGGLPIYHSRFPLSEYGTLQVLLENEVFEPLTAFDGIDFSSLAADYDFKTEVQIDRRAFYGQVRFIPIRKNPITGDLEKLTSFRLRITLRPQALPTRMASRNGINSALSTGEIYKLAVAETGVYKMDYAFLSNIGIDVDNLDPRTIQIFGNGGGALPELNSQPREQDVAENAIIVVGEADGSFDANDYILFYGEQADKWSYDPINNRFFMRRHYYDNFNHYFLKVGEKQGKRIQDVASASGASYTTTSFDDYANHNEDLVNLLDYFLYAGGTGKIWYGESFKFTTNREFKFSFPNLVAGEPVSVKTAVAARTVGTSLTNRFDVAANGQLLYSMNINGVDGNIEHTYANLKSDKADAFISGNELTVGINFIKATSDTEGWLDYIEVNARRSLVFINGQMPFRDKNSIGKAVSKFILTGNNGLTIWNVTDLKNIRNQTYSVNGNQLEFGAATTDLQEFIAFDGSTYLTPTVVDTLDNQNLHAITVPDLLIVYHQKFETEVQRLAAHRRNHSGFEVATAEISQVYNEFSSGNADVSAIRDFAKYLYDQDPKFKYLLLFGDASFDFKNIRNDPNNHHYVPAYETQVSNEPLSGYVTDDFFGLLDVNDGGIESGALDIAIGRLTVRTTNEARDVVDKIIRYDTDTKMLGDWVNQLTFVADDEDNNLHINDADGIAVQTANQNPGYNINKIYLDAYKQISTQGGNRFPGANQDIHSSLFKGTLTINYTGHGDDAGWAQERILKETDIASWKNPYRLPLFVTATCTFAPYDAPHKVSAGEQILLRPDGGAIALFTTVRAVFASSNEKLTRSSFDKIFDTVNGDNLPIGEILRLAKNTSGAGTRNSRKFVLLGDPSLTLAYPKYKVETTTINNTPITNQDTIKALQKVTIEGYIENPNGGGILSTYNGTIYPTVYDKAQSVNTLANDPGNGGSQVRTFRLQKNIIFKGRASVTNGKFSFTFVVPKDIKYDYGFGKISYYAENGTLSETAAGYYKGIVIGGTDSTAVADNQGPKVEVFMNDDKFVFGGMTDNSPTIYVKLSDDNGINTVGTSIGHDITALLDDNTQQTFVLNDFYESSVDDYTSGEARYPLSDLELGLHSVRVKAWDISNNSGEGYTEFVVAEDASMALSRVLNYPNPFTTNTEFQFEHNYPSQPLAVQVQIFSVNGNLVKTIQTTVQPEGYRVTGITWDGTDDFGSPIGRGVYVYKVSVGAVNADGEISTSESAFEKLVILK